MPSPVNSSEELRLIQELTQAGQEMFARGCFDEARFVFEQILEHSPTHPDALMGLGKLYRELGLFKEAEGAHRQLVTAYPDNAGYWYDLGNSLRDQGERTEALKMFEQVLQLDPQDTCAQHLVAVLKGNNPATPPDAYVLKLFDPYADRFDQHLVHKLGYDAPEKLATLVRQIIDMGCQFESALDLGCGTGLSGLAFRALTKHLTGIDLSQSMLARAQTKGVYDLLEQTSLLKHLKSTSETFDLFIATDVLIYVGELDRLFEQVRKRSRPGALFVFSTESVEGPDYEALASGRYAHSMFYIQRLADRFGFQVTACQAADIRQEMGDGVNGHLFVLEVAGS